MGWDGALLVSGKGLLQVAGRFWSLGRVVVSWRLLLGWRRCCKGCGAFCDGSCGGAGGSCAAGGGSAVAQDDKASPGA